MSSFSSLSRGLVVVAALTAGAAAAQPVNDACTGAETLTFTGGSALSTLINPNGSVAAPEAPMSCDSTAANTVWFQFTAPATAIYTIGTCATGTNYDTVLAVYTGTCAGLVQLTGVCNDDGCAPQSTVAPTLTGGTTYYVQVAGYGASTVVAASRAQLAVSYSPPPANDFCAAATPLTPSATPGTTVSAPLVGVNGAAAATEVTVACIGSKNDVWYSFVAPVSGPYKIDTCGASNYDTTMAVYTGACGALTALPGACNDQGGCTPSNASSVITSLVSGTTYYVQVAAWSSATLTSTSTSGLNVTLLGATMGDQCSAGSPQLSLNVPVNAVTAPIDAGIAPAFDDSRIDGGAACFTGLGQTSSTAPGRDVAWQFRAADAGSYSFRISSTTPSLDAVLYVTDSCIPVTSGPVSYGPPQCMAAANRTTSGSSEQVSCTPLTANQTVYVWVDEASLSTAGSTTSLEVTSCNAESEPNDTPATAGALSCVMTGGMGTAGDVDFYAIGAPPAGSRLFAMAEAAAANVNNFDLRVTTETTTLEYDDLNLVTAFGASAPVVAGTVLNGLPAYLRVNYNTGIVAEPYLLYSAVQFGEPTLEIEPNQTFATATTGATNYFSGSITDGGTDVDVYSFTANAGEVIFAALDAVPEKRDAGVGAFNLAMSLIDSTSAVLVAVDDTSNTVTMTPGATLTASTPIYPGEGLVYRVRTTGSYGIRVNKTSGLTPNAYFLSISVGCTDVAPTLASLTPTSGSPSGGQTITLTGTNFSTRSVVRFGNAIATIVSVTPTQLVVLSPTNPSGEVAVSVTNGAGLTASLNPGYTYDDPPGIPPTLLTITPAFGPVDGGTVVTLTGTVFRADAGVFFDVGGTVIGAASVTVNSAARITATTPAHAEGIASVKVVNYDALESTLPNAFTYQGPPTVSSITPNTGLTTGGQTITLAGTNLRAGTTVRIGGTLATGVVLAPDGLSATLVTPSSTVNTAVDVIVRTSDGQTLTLVGAFTYSFPAPTIATVTPSQGTTLGGTAITVTGTGFQPAPTVTVGGVAATSVVRTSLTSLTAVTPAGTAGLADVRVTNSDAQAITATGAFRYIAPPLVTAITPVHGPVQGGTLVTLTGQDFLPGASVRLGGVPAFAVTVINSTTATAVTNANAAGAVDVQLINPDAQNSTLTAAFTYDPAPTLVSLTPLSGTTAGGTVVALTGTGFLAGATVLFGSDAATSVNIVSATELTAVTPARPVGVVSVTVRNTDNQSAELLRAYRFVAPPTLTAATPNTGDVAGGTLVRLTGSGFAATSTVSFGGSMATQVTQVSGTELDVLAPAHARGAVDVVVSTDGAIATLAGGFTYVRGAPTLTGLAPASGPVAGGTLISLSGTGFASGATVSVGGEAATDVVIVSDVLARAVVPAHAAGAADVVFTNDDQQAATLAAAFTYVAPLDNNTGTVTDGGTGSIGEGPTGGGGGAGGVSCGCSSFDGSMFSLAGMGMLLVLSRRRRR